MAYSQFAAIAGRLAVERLMASHGLAAAKFKALYAEAERRCRAALAGKPTDSGPCARTPGRWAGFEDRRKGATTF
jgi:hypothetical protein